ncbi:hypothetical protein NS365_21900 [Aureimonas ureilytica]|uniref:Uncharacterized protein n=1 Tax=Aureimonas ureilytica TaxID=401562 RepID=A0A175RF80_9HYPH|nr:hypothetical protein NS365_21900 [Aureimonas ureilytica]
MHRGGQIGLTRRHGAAPLENVQPLRQLRGDLIERQDAHPARREFDRQRQPVHRPADRLCCVRRPALQGKLRRAAARPRQKEIECGGLVQHRQAQLHLAGIAQRRSAGGDDAKVFRALQKRVDQRGGVLGHMLAIVENQHQLGVAQPADDRLSIRPATGLRHVHGGGHRAEHGPLARQAVEAHQRGAARVRLAPPPQPFQHQPRLADPAGAGDGDEGRRAGERTEFA